jgi:hypothetical protein
MSHTIAPGVATAAKLMPSHAVIVRKGRPKQPFEPKTPISRETQRIAAAILEVLAGVRTPAAAAAALGIAVPRYYLWEQRALEGLVTACEPRPAGKGQSPQYRIRALEKEVTRLRQECSRQQALVRASQRTIGLTPPPKPPVKPVGKKDDQSGGRPTGKKHRQRRPVVRALKAAAAIRTAAIEEGVTSSSGAVSTEVLQPGLVSSPSLPMEPLHVATAPAGG